LRSPGERSKRSFAPAVAILAVVSVGLASPGTLAPQMRYELRDTASWSNGLYGGTRATLYLAGAPVDTVDLLRGVQVAAEGLLYRPVGEKPPRWIECGEDEVCWDLRPWVLRTEEGARPLTEVVPDLDPFLSSPLVVDGDLYYFGFEKGDASYGVSARWFDFESGAMRVLYLGDDTMETDDPGHVPGPEPEGSCVLFRFHGRRLLVGPALRDCGGEP